MVGALASNLPCWPPSKGASLQQKHEEIMMPNIGKHRIDIGWYHFSCRNYWNLASFRMKISDVWLDLLDNHPALHSAGGLQKIHRGVSAELRFVQMAEWLRWLKTTFKDNHYIQPSSNIIEAAERHP